MSRRDIPKIAQRFIAGFLWQRELESRQGRMKNISGDDHFSAVPTGLLSHARRRPSVETLGYFRLSLRDRILINNELTLEQYTAAKKFSARKIQNYPMTNLFRSPNDERNAHANDIDHDLKCMVINFGICHSSLICHWVILNSSFEPGILLHADSC